MSYTFFERKTKIKKWKFVCLQFLTQFVCTFLTANQHVTITNGTVFNGTSTPIKDKYVSDEKEFGEMMNDFLDHKYGADSMKIEPDNKNREQIIEDANRLVSGK